MTCIWTSSILNHWPTKRWTSDDTSSRKGKNLSSAKVIHFEKRKRKREFVLECEAEVREGSRSFDWQWGCFSILFLFRGHDPKFKFKFSSDLLFNQFNLINGPNYCKLLLWGATENNGKFDKMRDWLYRQWSEFELVATAPCTNLGYPFKQKWNQNILKDIHVVA